MYVQFGTKSVQKMDYGQFEKFEDYAMRITEKLNKMSQVDCYKQNSGLVANKLCMLKSQKKIQDGFELSKQAFGEFKVEIKLKEHIIENLELLTFFSFFALNVENYSSAFQFNSLALGLIGRELNPRLIYDYKGLMTQIMVFARKRKFNSEKKDTFLILVLNVFFLSGICFLELKSYKKALKMFEVIQSVNTNLFKDDGVAFCIENLVSKTKVSLNLTRK